jgi:hypothetical protein
LAETYRSGAPAGFPNAANILDNISSLLESGKATRSDLDEAYQELTDAVRKDFSAMTHSTDILDGVDAILSRPSRIALEHSNALMAMLSEKALHKCNEIIALSNRVADRDGDTALVVHLMCFVYLLLLEGPYDSTLRFLYAYYLQRLDTGANIADIKKKFDEDHIGRSIFDGWNRTVRNAIAHATYSLDKGTRMVEFEDVQGRGKERLTILQFHTLVRRAYDVSTAASVLLTLRIFVPHILRDAEELSVSSSP